MMTMMMIIMGNVYDKGNDYVNEINVNDDHDGYDDNVSNGDDDGNADIDGYDHDV